jgi:hypothetical protein
MNMQLPHLHDQGYGLDPVTVRAFAVSLGADASCGVFLPVETLVVHDQNVSR